MTDSRRDRGRKTPGRRKGDKENCSSPAELSVTGPLRPAVTTTLAAALAAAIVAILLRVPVCGESLWVDELHSAWAVWGEWREVAVRAAWGNQTPWYFYVLWGWRNMVGDSEIALRMPSVLATALASTVLVVGVARNGGGLLGGAIAGLLLAVDRNAIFFGTEARPYAGVILAVATAAWAAAELRSAELRSPELGEAERSAGGSSSGGGVWWPRFGLLLACFVGFLLHATAAIPLAVLATTLFVWPLGGGEARAARGIRGWGGLFGPRPFSVYVYLAVVAVMGLVLWINAEVIFRVWSERSQWNAFGRPRSFRELWTIWPWIWLVLVPCGVWIAARVWSRPRGFSSRRLLDPILAAALLATAVAWAISCLDIAPIWHRRFMVGVLPLLCWAAGGYWGASLPVGRVCNLPVAIFGRLRTSPTFALFAAVAVGGLMFSQGTLAELLAGDRVLVHRGEDWRGAVAYLNQHRRPSEPVFVAAELLESTALDPPPKELSEKSPEPSPGMIEYLRYPVSGPYGVEDAIPLGRQAASMRHAMIAEAGRRERVPEPVRGWVLLRRGESQSRAILAGNFGAADSEPRVEPLAVYSFGGVTLVRFSVIANE